MRWWLPLVALNWVLYVVPAGGSNEKAPGYFNVYGHPDIHRQMLQDRPRTEAYARALSKEPAVVRGKTVLDFGCGTGILSAFAAKAGALRVICVEASPMAEVAEKVFAKNNLSDRVHVVRATHTQLKLPAKVDVIISEWMGFFMVMEDMLADLLYVRDHWLKPGGVVWPRFAQMWMQPYADAEWWADNVDYWNSEPYGVDLSPMQEYAFEKSDIWPYPLRAQWRPAGLIGRPHLLSEWDLQSLKMPQSFRAASSFRLPVKNTTVHGVLFWFDCVFDHPDGNVTLSTHPAAGVQHWNQVFWPLKGAPLRDPKLVLSGVFRMQRKPPAWNFTLSWKARPLVTETVTASTGPLYAESFSVSDEWTSRRSLEVFTGLGDTSAGEGGSPAGRTLGNSASDSGGSSRSSEL